MSSLFNYSENHTKYRPDIDGLRAVAVLLVVAFHAFPDRFRSGFIGVDIFFVISGFLITGIIVADLNLNKFSFINFYFRRIKRIFPALLIVLATCLIVGWLFFQTGEYAQLGKHVAGGAAFLSNFLFWNESGYFDGSADTKPLLHLWSLGIEEQFYLVWPLLIWAAFKSRYIAVIILLIFLLSFGLSLQASHGNSAEAFYGPHCRFWELLIGAMALLIFARKESFLKNYSAKYLIWMDQIFSLFGVILLLVGFSFIDKNKSFPGWWALLPTIGTALILISNGSFINRWIFSSRFLVFIGLVSFPLYLWHWPIFTFYRIISIEDVGEWIYLPLIFISFIFAVITYQVIEKQCRRSDQRYLPLVLLIAMIGMGFIGFNYYDREGLPFRKVVQHEYNFTVKSGSKGSVCESGCSNRSINTPITVVFLWGDSHADQLYAGLYKASQRYGFILEDATHGGCPPILNFDPRGEKSEASNENALCRQHNYEAVRKIKAYKPDTIILAGRWNLYNGMHQYNQLSVIQLKQTIAALKDLGIKNIYLFGTFPQYHSNVPRLGSSIFLNSHATRTYRRFNYQTMNSDSEISNLADDARVGFISPINSLCDREGCLISTSSENFEPIIFDDNHLSKIGSEFFIDLLLNKKILILPGMK